MKKLLAPLLLLTLAIMPIAGCKPASSTTPPAALVPGAANQFDQDSYKALMAAQASLNSLKQSVVSDPNAASLKPIVNQAIQDYNIADLAWQTYHAAAAAGTSTQAQQLAVTNSLNSVQADLAKAGK